MKHQVFLFFAIVSFSLHSMNNDKQIVTGICDYCSRVNFYFPTVFSQADVKKVKKDIKELMYSSLPEQEKIERVKQGLVYLPHMVMVGDRPILLDSYEKNDYTTNG